MAVASSSSSSRSAPAASSATADDNEPYLLRFLVSRIVGMRYYRGKISGREAVGLVHEPLNWYDDSNAIAVYNARGEQAVHLPGTLAKVLAPLLDSSLVAAATGIVPRSGSKINPNAYNLPCQVHLFARPAAATVVEAALHEADLDLIHADYPELALSQAAEVIERTKNKKGDRDVDKLISLVGKKGGKDQVQPMVPPADVVLSELFEHQKEVLGWMVHREESANMPPFWQECEDGGFENVLTNHKTERRRERAKEKIREG